MNIRCYIGIATETMGIEYVDDIGAVCLSSNRVYHYIATLFSACHLSLIIIVIRRFCIQTSHSILPFIESSVKRVCPMRLRRSPVVYKSGPKLVEPFDILDYEEGQSHHDHGKRDGANPEEPLRLIQIPHVEGVHAED